jgi:translation initiation factor IF-3
MQRLKKGGLLAAKDSRINNMIQVREVRLIDDRWS